MSPVFQQPLPQQDEFLAQFIFQLGPMMMHGDLQRAQHFVAKNHAMMMLHIQELDGEHVRRMLQFLPGHDQRRGMFLAMPPLHHRTDGGQVGKRTFAQEAEQVQIGELGLEFPGRGRTVENDALKILTRGLSYTADEFVELFFCDHSETSRLYGGRASRPSIFDPRQNHRRYKRPALQNYSPRLPASAGATAAGTASAKSSKPAAAAAEASTATVAPASASSNSEQEHPEQDLAQRSKQHDQ